MNTREMATVLAALRLYQSKLLVSLYGGHLDTDIDGIASNLGTIEPLKADEIDALAERLNLGPEKKPTITVSIDRNNDKFVVFVPKAIADDIEVDFIEPDDVAPVSYYESHGVEHPCQTHDRLLKDENHVCKEFD